MLDSFDFKEPRCSLCDGKEFYNPKLNTPQGRIPVDRIISKVDNLFNKNDYVEAGKLLEYWENEAIVLNDKMGELSILNELVGYYRKVGDKDKAYLSIERSLKLVDELDQSNIVSGATVFLNCATAYKAFGDAKSALALYEQAEKLYVKLLKENDERFGGLYNNMALALVDLGDYNQAENSYNKAISVMKKIPNGQADLAITYVNLAHLYELTNNYNAVTDSMFTAYNLLNTETLVRDGYYAYVCEKCAPSFEYFGYKIIAEELIKTAGELYARS